MCDCASRGHERLLVNTHDCNVLCYCFSNTYNDGEFDDSKTYADIIFNRINASDSAQSVGNFHPAVYRYGHLF